MGKCLIIIEGEILGLKFVWAYHRIAFAIIICETL